MGIFVQASVCLAWVKFTAYLLLRHSAPLLPPPQPPPPLIQIYPVCTLGIQQHMHLSWGACTSLCIYATCKGLCHENELEYAVIYGNVKKSIIIFLLQASPIRTNIIFIEGQHP